MVTACGAPRRPLRQERAEKRIGNTVEARDAAGWRRRRRAGPRYGARVQVWVLQKNRKQPLTFKVFGSATSSFER